ncbi:DUF2254 domain-containing protein [Sutcliffiella horikoshii]|uniref:DUF2254 domain-containing protein n=1 Tax=Sutcliffiella horikoshii TaxID=79883 RepID=UPI001CBCD95A|nr:DUF2254 domain-containing protein [Sutcliffiella horikoshii]UAL47268.1 DUF2254 domain-containing protein [Sutcliffiella horikoshii]
MEKWTLRARKEIWFVPSLYALASIILTAIVISVDTVFADSVQNYLPKMFFTNVDLSTTILSSIATAILTMTTISFSTIMVVLTTYSSQFSPRTLQDFMTEKTTLRVLGVFVGSFIYTVLSLLFMKDWLDEQRVLASGVGVILAVICVGYFVFFIHHVARSIQVSKLIERLMKEGLVTVKKKKLLYKAEKIIFEKMDIPSSASQEKMELTPKATGYVQVIDTEGLAAKGKEHGFHIVFNKRIGDFVTERSVIAIVYFKKEKPEDVDLTAFIEVGEERTPLQDGEFALQKLAEVALRAISPGINDPNTANNCIRYMSRLLMEFGEVDADAITYLDEDKEKRVTIPQRNFEEILYTGFYQIRIYGERDISVVLTTLECLILIAEGSNQEIKEKVKNMWGFLVDSIKEDYFEPLDVKMVEEKKKKLSELLN